MPVKIGNITVVGNAPDDFKKDAIYCIEYLDEKIKNKIPLDYEFLLVDGKNGGLLIEAIECIFKKRQPSKLLKEFITGEIGKDIDSPRESTATSKDTNIKDIIFKCLSRVMERLPGRIIVVGNEVLTGKDWEEAGGEIAGWLKRRVAWIDKFENVTINGLKTKDEKDFDINVEDPLYPSKFKLLLYSTWLKKSFDTTGYKVVLKFGKSDKKLTLESIRENICLFQYRLLKKIGKDIKGDFFLIPFCCGDDCLPSYQQEGWGDNLKGFIESYDTKHIDDRKRYQRTEVKEGDYFDIVEEIILIQTNNFQSEENPTEKEEELRSELNEIKEDLSKKRETISLPSIYNLPTDSIHRGEFNFEVGDGNLILEYTRHLSQLRPRDFETTRSTIDSHTHHFYQESLSGASLHYSFLYNIFSEDDKNKKADLVFKLAENGLIRILVADERISDFFSSREEIKKMYQCAGITVVENLDKFIDNIHKISDIPELKSMKMKTQHPIVSNFYAFIIHQGILDKTKLCIEELEKYIDDWKKDHFSLIIVTSGRGTPSNIPRNVRFIPFSVLESNLISSHPGKFILTNTLFKALARRVR